MCPAQSPPTTCLVLASPVQVIENVESLLELIRAFLDLVHVYQTPRVFLLRTQPFIEALGYQSHDAREERTRLRPFLGMLADISTDHQTGHIIGIEFEDLVDDAEGSGVVLGRVMMYQ